MRTSPRANMRGDVLSSQLARKGRCQGAAVRATRETSRRGSHDKARPGREDTFHQRRRRRRKRQDAKSKNTGKARKAPGLRRAPRCDAHLPRKAAKKETPRREKQEHGKSPQSAPRRVPDVKGKVTGGSHDKARPERERAFIKKSGEGLDARARKARSRRRPTKRPPSAAPRARKARPWRGSHEKARPGAHAVAAARSRHACRPRAMRSFPIAEPENGIPPCVQPTPWGFPTKRFFPRRMTRVRLHRSRRETQARSLACAGIGECACACPRRFFEF